jgi:hypothetical protein
MAEATSAMNASLGPCPPLAETELHRRLDNNYILIKIIQMIRSIKIIVFFSFLIFLVSGCANERQIENIPQNNQGKKENNLKSDQAKNLKSCVNERVCEEGYVCYDSQYSGMGPNGLVSGTQKGDLLCHKICVSDNECENGECHEVEMTGGDVMYNIKFCMENNN